LNLPLEGPLLNVYVPVMFSSLSDRINSALDGVECLEGMLVEDNVGLNEFAQCLMHLDAQRDGFGADDVESVEAMWGYSDANFFWMGGYVVRLRDGRRAYFDGTSCPEFSDDGETYELEWTFDVRLLAEEPYHSLTPLQPSERSPLTWEEAPKRLNKFLKRLAV
jgi:hypothetical protein